MKIRLRIFEILFALSIVGLIARLFFWQVIKASELAKLGQLQYSRQENLISSRGSIFAADGSYLVADENDWTIFATKVDLKESPRTVANKLAPLLSKKAENIEALLNKDGVWLPIEYRVKNDIKKNIESLKLAGVGFEEEPGRYYPEGSSSAHMLGFVGKDSQGKNIGYFGLEGYYDLTLAGKPGLINRESGADGIPILFGNSKEVNATGGVDLVTNIDKRVQLTVEKELKNAMTTYEAKSGTVIMMNPKTGAIIAMASLPSFAPATYWKYTNDEFKNPAITDTFEPGSIFKPIVMAAALDAKVVDENTKCDICDAPVKVDKYEIDTWNHEHHPDSSMANIIINSDNIGMVFVGNKLGSSKLYDYLYKFGFGKKTGIDLQGEVNIPLREKEKWSIIDLATTTFGQGIAVTPIQILQGISVIANKGNMVKPIVVKEIKNGDWTSEIKPQAEGKVISDIAAKEIKDMMVATVKEGEAKWAAPAGFKIAGKTGTAQIPIAGHYDPTKTIASFVGFAPADDPKFVMLVTLYEPQSSIYGAETAAPLWFNIAKDLFPYFGIQPEN